MRTSSRERPQEPPGARGHRAPPVGAGVAGYVAAGGQGQAGPWGPATASRAGDAGSGHGPVCEADRRYDPYLDGLFTYCLSVTREHDSANAAVGEALAIAERQWREGREPDEPALLRCWLYSLTRWACHRRLGHDRRRGGQPPVVTPRTAGGTEAEQRRRELAALAWPEAGGTTTQQREALELAVRHQLATTEVARVLRLPVETTRSLLTGAACEVERARGALAALRAGGCPMVGALAGEDRLLLAAGQRLPVMRHVDECPVCRPVAQRALAGVAWPGTAPAGAGRLAVLPAHRQAVHAARLAVLRARAHHTPKFDRTGFPLDERDRAARRERLRGRALTTTVVATVLAAPALALCAAFRGAPTGGEGGGLPSVADDDRDPGYDEYPYEHAGRTGVSPGGGSGGARRSADGAEAGPSPTGGTAREREHEGTGIPTGGGPVDAGDGGAPAPSGPASPEGGGHLAVEATATADGTRIVLTATGDEAVEWHAHADVAWLSLSRSAGWLHPGEQRTLLVTVDRDAEPAGLWSGRVTIGPDGSVVTVTGRGGAADDEPDDSGSPVHEPERGREPEPTEFGTDPDDARDGPPERETDSPGAGEDAGLGAGEDAGLGTGEDGGPRVQGGARAGAVPEEPRGSAGRGSSTDERQRPGSAASGHRPPAEEAGGPHGR